MSQRRRGTWWLQALTLVLLLVVPAWAQDEGAPVGDEPADPLAEESVDVQRIEEILRGEEDVFSGERFSYDPAGRRDPFRSLLEGIDEGDDTSPRPPGLPGTLIEELEVGGIITTSSGVLAFAQGRDNLSYILRPGTKLYNGEVVEITPSQVVFRQTINDPKSLKPYREVVRDLSTR